MKKTFQFNIAPYIGMGYSEPIWIEPSYWVERNKVILADMGIPPFIFARIIDAYQVHNDIFWAADNNAKNEGLIKPTVDIFDELSKYFNPKN